MSIVPRPQQNCIHCNDEARLRLVQSRQGEYTRITPASHVMTWKVDQNSGLTDWDSAQMTGGEFVRWLTFCWPCWYDHKDSITVEGART